MANFSIFGNLCFFLDNIDGKIARLLKSNSNFGVELDSLSDLISFGVTPAIIVYLWSESMSIQGMWAMVIFYAICSTSRLAKFNISSQETESIQKKSSFFLVYQHQQQLDLHFSH